MARIANIVTPARGGVPGTIPVYSRVVTLQVNVLGGVGQLAHQATPPLGNRVILKKIRLWFMPDAHPGSLSCYLALNAGTSRDVSFLLIRDEWDTIMDISGLLPAGYIIHCCASEYTFDMNKLYVGESIRFGVAIQNTSGQHFFALAAFQVAEG